MDLKEIYQKDNIHPILEEAIIKMISGGQLPYYGGFCFLLISWKRK